MLMYIDPGTGSMLFTILMGVFGAGIYGARNLSMKLKFRASGGKAVPVDTDRVPIAIFSDDKRYWNVFEPICDRLEAQGQEAVYLTASSDDPALQKRYQHIRCRFIGEGNRAFAVLNTLKADILLSTTPGLEVYQWKRSKDVKWYVHIPHASTDLTLYRMFGIDYYDAVLISGDYQEAQIRALERLRDLPPKEIELVGCTYLDVMRERLKRSGPAPAHETTVLLAPSWGQSAILSRYGERMIDALLNTGYHIVIRPHPQSFKSETELIERLMRKYPASDKLEWNRDNDNFEILRRADIMISDFSGVIFDYTLVYDKPVIYADTKFDKGPYDAWWLEEEPWTFRALRLVGRALDETMLGDLRGVIDECLSGEDYASGRRQARSETWQCAGEGAERATDYLLCKLEEIRNSTAGQ